MKHEEELLTETIVKTLEEILKELTKKSGVKFKFLGFGQIQANGLVFGTVQTTKISGSDALVISASKISPHYDVFNSNIDNVLRKLRLNVNRREIKLPEATQYIIY